MSSHSCTPPYTVRAAWSSLDREIQEHLIKTLPITTLAKIRRKPEWAELITEELARRWNVCLAGGSLNPTATRSMMRSTNTILSGSAALNIMLPTSCTPADLDFYCPRSTGVNVAMFFYAVGYRLLPRPNGIRRRYGSMCLGLNFVLTMRHKDDPSKKVNIIESSSNSPHAPLLYFHSTTVMNFVSADGYAMLYPRLTCAKKGLINRVSAHTDVQNLEGLAKYVRRGFTLTDTCAHAGPHAGERECFHALRSSEDGYFLRVPFDEGDLVSIHPSVEWSLGSLGHQAPSTVRVRVQMTDGSWATVQ